MVHPDLLTLGRREAGIAALPPVRSKAQSLRLRRRSETGGPLAMLLAASPDPPTSSCADLGDNSAAGLGNCCRLDTPLQDDRRALLGDGIVSSCTPYMEPREEKPTDMADLKGVAPVRSPGLDAVRKLVGG